MRAHIDLVAKLMEAPGQTEDDEWFSANYGIHEINVDEARRLIASGEVKAKPYAMPVKLGGMKLLGLPESQFGSGSDEEGDLDVFQGAAVDRKHAKSIPDEKFAEPLLMVMWNEYEGLKSGFKKPQGLDRIDPAATRPLLVDGNHRLTRRFLEGDEGTLPTLVVTDWADIAKFTYVNGRKIGR